MAKGLTPAYSAGIVNQLRVKIKAELGDVDQVGSYVADNVAHLTRKALEKVLIETHKKSLGDMELKGILEKFVLDNWDTHQVTYQ